MILEYLANARQYRALGPRLALALDFLTNTNLETLSLGEHKIDGDQVFARVAEYETYPPDKGFWEAHRKYIDVQYMVRGAERFGLSPLHLLNVTEEYRADRDDVRLKGTGDYFELRQGMVAILFPHDAHHPSIAIGQPARVKKVVVKVAV